MDNAAPPPVAAKKRSRLVEYLIVLVIIAFVFGLAFFQESIGYFFRLRLWDKAAPAKTVEGFLSAWQKGDQQAAGSYLGAKEYQPLMQNGKWAGYFMVTQAGKLEFMIDELIPPSGPKATSTEFITIGEGAAEVTVPDKNNKPIKYRVVMQDGWKVTEILGGRPAK